MCSVNVSWGQLVDSVVHISRMLPVLSTTEGWVLESQNIIADFSLSLFGSISFGFAEFLVANTGRDGLSSAYSIVPGTGSFHSSASSSRYKVHEERL